MATFIDYIQTMIEAYLNNGLFSLTAILSLIQIPAAYICTRNYYSVKSKIMELYFYLDEKYGIESGMTTILARKR